MALHKIPYAVSYRKIKYPRIELKTGKVLLIIPFGKKPDAILEKHEQWIHRKLDFIGKCLKASSGKKLADRADTEFRELINCITDEVSRQLRVRLKGISFRKMRTKWASLSSRRNLTINRLMRHLPDHLLSYVIFHEVVHLKEKRHNDKFWKRISKKFDDYQELEKDLFVYWFQVVKRIQ